MANKEAVFGVRLSGDARGAVSAAGEAEKAVDKLGDAVQRNSRYATTLGDSFSEMGRRVKSFDFSRLNFNIPLGSIVTGASAAAAGLAALTMKAAENAREIDNLARVANAGGEEFQRFAAGAKSVGIEQDKAADILKDVNDKIGDFMQTGAGPMADFFENVAPLVGVTADQFRRLSGPEALQLYVSSLEKAGVSQAEMTFYMESLASDSTLLLPLLRDNGTEMERLGDRAQALGAVLSDTDREGLKAVAEGVDTLKGAAAGLGNELMRALLPQMGELSGYIQDPETVRSLGAIAQGIGSVAQAAISATVELSKFAGWFGEALAASIHGPHADDIVRLEERLTNFQRLRSESWFNRAMDGFSDEELDAEIKRLQALIDAFYERERNRPPIELPKIADEEAGGPTSRRNGHAGRTLMEIKQEADARRKAAEEQEKAAKKLQAEQDKQRKAQEALEKSNQSLLRSMFPLEKANGEYVDGLKALDKLMKAELITQDQWTSKVKTLREAYEDAIDPARKMIREYKEETDQLRASEAARKSGNYWMLAEIELRQRGGELTDKNIDSLAREMERREKMNEQLRAQQQLVDESNQRWQEMWSRLDAMGEDIFFNIVDNAEVAFDDVEELFKRTWSNMLYHSTVRPLFESAASGVMGLIGIGGGSSGSGSGFNLGSLVSSGSTLSSLWSGISGMWGAGSSGWASGGFGGLLNGIGSYVGDGVASALGGWFGGGSAVGANAASAMTGASNAAWNTAWAGSLGEGGAQALGMQGGSSAMGSAMSYAPYLAAVYGIYKWISDINDGLYDLKDVLTGDWFDIKYTDYLNSKGGIGLGDAAASVMYTLHGNPIESAKSAYKSLFGGDWVAKGSGISLAVDGGTLEALGYTKQKKSGGLLGSSKSRERITELDADLQDSLQQTFEEVTGGVFELFEAVGVQLGDDALAGFSSAVLKISTNWKGKAASNEEIQQAIAEWFSTTSDQLVSHFSESAGTAFGGGLTTARLAALAAGLQQTNATLGNINVRLLDISPAGALAAESLLTVAGGLDSFNELAGGYYNAFFSESERFADQTRSIRDALSGLNYELPDSRRAFRDLVSEVDAMGESGQKTAVALLNLWPAMDQYFQRIEQQEQLLSQQQSANLGRADSFIERLTLDALGTGDAQYGYFKAQADTLAQLIPTLSDSASITDTYDRAMRAAEQAYSLLDASVRPQSGAEFAAYVNSITESTNKRLEEVQDENTSATDRNTKAQEGVVAAIDRLTLQMLEMQRTTGNGQSMQLVEASLASLTGALNRLLPRSREASF